MQADLDKERKATTRLWAKREEQIRGVIYLPKESTAAALLEGKANLMRMRQEIPFNRGRDCCA